VLIGMFVNVCEPSGGHDEACSRVTVTSLGDLTKTDTVKGVVKAIA
jgi:hypothetical protein